MEEAIILAGGKGTRLHSLVSEMPKSMAPINGIPFLSYQLDYLAKHKFKTIYLAVGHLSDKIINFYGDSYQGMQLVYSVENEPLGTGGAISKALKLATKNNVLVLNGDTLFYANLEELYHCHTSTESVVTMALKALSNFNRYGVVQTNEEHQVIAFEEKKQQNQGQINGGIYVLNKEKFSQLHIGNNYSFESDFLETFFTSLKISGISSNGYFLDIGIPSDYQQAQVDFKRFHSWPIDKTWTLFLDRDGVINKQIKNGYVTSVKDFTFLDGVLDCFSHLTHSFGRIIVVTNQQCIGKGIITSNELNAIHTYMKQQIELHGGRIDQIYYAPDLDSNDNLLRKPNTGMAELAFKEFPEIIFEKSIVVGDSNTDIEFGKKMNMKTVLISTEISPYSDKCFESLENFSKSLS